MGLGWQVGSFASKTSLAAVAGLALPSLALAAGLGKLTVLSSLGQPLKAEIEIVSLQRGEGDSLGARLAPSDVFRQAGVDLNQSLLSVKFAVQRKDSGQYVMAVNSVQPVNEPFVDMLVELNWANGRLVREYTFLLDPPEYSAPKSSAAQAAAPPLPVAPPIAASQEPPAGVQAAPAEPAPVIAAVPLGANVPGSPPLPKPRQLQRPLRQTRRPPWSRSRWRGRSRFSLSNRSATNPSALRWKPRPRNRPRGSPRSQV